MLRLQLGDFWKMNWTKIFKPKQSSNRIVRNRRLSRSRVIGRKSYKGFTREHNLGFYKNYGSLSWAAHRRNFTIIFLGILFCFWLNPLLEEARNKMACINISTKVVRYFYPEGEEPLDADEFASYSAYKDCTFGD